MKHIPPPSVNEIHEILGLCNRVSDQSLLRKISSKLTNCKSFLPYESVYMGTKEAYILNKHPAYQLLSAVKYGVNVKFIQYLLERQTPTTHDCQRAFLWACQRGHLHIAKLIWQMFPDIIRRMDNNETFYYACIGGNIRVAQWLLRTFSDINPWLNNDYSFCTACCNNHLPMAQWLVRTFPAIDHRTQNDTAFTWTCENGYLEMAQWLIQTFPDMDPGAQEDYAFTHACERGNLHVAKWLLRTFPEIRHRVCDEQVVYDMTLFACHNGHLRTVQWIIQTFTNVDYRKFSNHFIDMSYSHHYLHVAEWLTQMFSPPSHA